MNRRTYVWLIGTSAVGGITSLSGCSGTGGGEDGGEGGGATGTSTTNETTMNAGSGDLSGPVPPSYRTAASKDGTKRNPDELSVKEAVQYQSQPRSGQQCSKCRLYIPDKNDDGLGACSVVEGYIEPKAWCVSFAQQ
jgi:hypothetical protein